MTDQFRSFYPQWRTRQLNTSMETCNATLVKYRADYDSYGVRGRLSIESCQNHLSCILDNTPEAWKASNAAASVALGLLPTLLATIGPTKAETSLLSTQRPVLACLVSLGAPATQLGRLFEYDDPIHLLSTHGDRLIVPRLGVCAAALVSGLEYLMATVAVCNALQTSYQLGLNTVAAASCTVWELPLIWSLLSIAVHLFAAIGFHIRRLAFERSRQDPSMTMDLQTSSLTVMSNQQNAATQTAPPHLPSSLPTRSDKGRRVTHLEHLWHIILQRGDFLPCSNLSRPSFSDKAPSVSPLVSIFAVLANSTAYVQLVCGTIWLASLQLVSVRDAVFSVLLRYALSAIIGRIVLLVELGGMRRITS